MKFFYLLGIFAAFAVVTAAPNKEEINQMNAQCEKVPNTAFEILPSPSDCSYFYICDGGQAWLHTCPPGLQFNPRDKVNFLNNILLLNY